MEDRKRLIIFSLMLLFVVSGCAQVGPLLKISQSSRRKYISNRPELATEIRQGILKGRVVKGMTREDVRASWGEPTEIRTYSEQDTFGIDEIWHYKASVFSFEPSRSVGLGNGIVVDVSIQYK